MSEFVSITSTPTPVEDLDRIVGIAELCAILSISERSLRRLLDQGKITSLNLGGSRRFHLRSVLKKLGAAV